MKEKERIKKLSEARDLKSEYKNNIKIEINTILEAVDLIRKHKKNILKEQLGIIHKSAKSIQKMLKGI